MLIAFIATLTATIALAAPVTVRTTLTNDGLLVRSDARLRFRIDYPTNTLSILEAQLESSSDQPLPEGVEATTSPTGLALHFPYPFQVTMAPDIKGLSIKRVSTPPLSAPPVSMAADVKGGAQAPASQPASEQTLPDDMTVLPESPTSTPASGGTPSANVLSEPSANPADDERLPMILPLSNASPNYVAGVLTRIYNVRVEVDERQRSLIVFVAAKDQALIRKVVEQLDAPRPQVMFEADILEVNQYMTQSLGIDYRELFSFNLTEGTPPVGNLLKFGDFARAPISIKIGLDLLKTTGAATTLAQPRITTLDGLEARLNATQTTPVVTAGQNGSVTVNNVTTGITLRLLPKVSPNGEIESSLSIAVSTPTGTSTQGVPQYSSREANTTVRVKNGEPIVIGGLLEKRDSTASKGLPGLGDIPILGELFKTTTTDSHFTDLVIVVTPYLIGSSAAPAEKPATKK
jgi:general secretion pathway protein D